MFAARLKGAGSLEVADEPVPAPGPGESLVRVTAVGLCGSDLHWFGQGAIGDAAISRPLVLGHEMGGVVVGGPLDRRRVAVDPAIPDNICPRVQGGQPQPLPSRPLRRAWEHGRGAPRVHDMANRLPIPRTRSHERRHGGALGTPWGRPPRVRPGARPFRRARSAWSGVARSGSCSCRSHTPPGLLGWSPLNPWRTDARRLPAPGPTPRFPRRRQPTAKACWTSYSRLLATTTPSL